MDDAFDRCPPGVCEANALALQRDDLYARLNRIYHCALSDADLAGMAVRDFLLRESGVAELPSVIIGLVPEGEATPEGET